ncbi:hypothetical protein JZY91_03325 [Corynebacterium sp. CNCTC7651]|uniref:hypothetical protein n=1 Tax=Corynebacterium sp. CNCTC7651 TaxID=2815361 RepID=UPI001F3DA577|nr:hypothetical protein [Corynebacterium sp. CNCTC7651]UIZ92806.1 hypothetical protein JZY91_03325 [Corynebacterium sp. CNCTC7651]
MTSSPARKTAAAALAALAALGIAACSPPNQNDSDQKIDTATSQNPSALASSGLSGETSAAAATNVAEASSVRASETASETATALKAADGTPQFNNCDQLGLERPTSLSLDCKDNREYLEDIVWDSWDANGAKGTATRITVDPDRVIEGETVTLGAPKEVDGRLVFTVISVGGNSINPESNY